MNRETIQKLLQEYLAAHALEPDGPTVLWVREDGQRFTLAITGSSSEIEVTVQETGMHYQYDIRAFS